MCVFVQGDLKKRKKKKSQVHTLNFSLCASGSYFGLFVWSQQSLYAQHCFRSGFGSFPSSPRRGRLSPWAKIMRKPPLYRFAVGNATSLGPNARISSSVGSSAGGAHAATGLGPSFRAENRSVSVSFCGSKSSWRSVQRRVPRDKQAACFLLCSAGGWSQK